MTAGGHRGGHRQLHTVCERFSWQCVYCRRPLRCAQCEPAGRKRIATRDHLVPKSRGGLGGANLVAACLQCNLIKGDGTPRRKAPKKRSLGGCQFSRSAGSARRRTPRKGYATFELAVAMCAAVAVDRGVELAPWKCPECSQWHINRPDDVPAALEHAS